MLDGLISKSAWINTRNIRHGSFAFVDIGIGRGWGNPPCTTKPTTCAQRRLGSAWASSQSDQSLRCPREESLGPWLAFECTAKTDQNPGPMEAVLKNYVHYVLVICKPKPIGAGDIAGVKCHVLTSKSSPQCCGTRDMGLLILMPRQPR